MPFCPSKDESRLQILLVFPILFGSWVSEALDGPTILFCRDRMYVARGPRSCAVAAWNRGFRTAQDAPAHGSIGKIGR